MASSLELISESVDETKRIAARLAAKLENGDIITLSGDLGAGKTQFVQGAGKELGIKSPITSPTFNIVSIYDEGRISLYHFDLYRLEDPLELEDIDFYSLTDSQTEGVSFIEWAEKFLDEMPEERLEISLFRESGDDDSRRIVFNAVGSRFEELLSQCVV